MTAVVEHTWREANQRHLSAELASLRDLLEAAAPEALDAGNVATGIPADHRSEVIDPPAALDVLSAGFGLSRFERLTLLMCVGMELEASFGDLLLRISGGRQSFPSFGLALAALPEGHWSALSPGRPLRRWHLVELLGGSVTTAELRVDERILHVLTGAGMFDEGLGGLLQTQPVAGWLPRSHAELSSRVADTLATAPDIVVQLLGPATRAKREIAADAAARLGAGAAVLDGRTLPTDARELDWVAMTVAREGILSGRILCLDADPVSDYSASGMLVDRAEATVVVCSEQPLELRRRQTVSFEVGRPTHTEQAELWRQLRGDAPEVHDVSMHFDLETHVIRGLAATAAPGELWASCQSTSRPRLGSLATHVKASGGWEQLVLPPGQLEVLRRIADHVRHKRTVFDTWEVRGSGGRGTGTTVLFSGPSGTGKTLAAEVLAHELRLDLYRVDLSAIVSKYIGETEKNLRRVFDSADDSSAVLLFDEADSLFGRRTEVKDSHDRFANIEVSYLLQRMEQYRGLAIMTTNMAEAVDPAFQRRIRFVVTFGFPDAPLREHIWRGVFGSRTPLADFDAAQLARLSLTGGSIRNIAVNAAFLAAADGGVVTMEHLRRAARDECLKLDQPWSGGVL